MNGFLYLFSENIFTKAHTNYAKKGLLSVENEHDALTLINQERGKEKYVNLFLLDKNAAPEIEGGYDFTGYTGEMRLAFETLPLDFDSKDNVQLAFDDVKKFIAKFNLENYQLFYSGAKGFHLYLHRSAIPTLPEQSRDLNKVITKACEQLKNDFPTLDTSIYTAVRKFRAPLSKHPKSGAFKIECAVSETLEAIKLRASLPTLGSWIVPVPCKASPELDVYFSDSYNVLGEPAPNYDEWQFDHEQTPDDETEALDFLVAFNKEQNKPCINGLISQVLKSGDRHDVTRTIIWTLINQGMKEHDVVKRMAPFTKANNPTEVSMKIRNAFNEQRAGKGYKTGCNNPKMVAHCKDTCSMYARLSVENRAKRPHAVTTNEKPLSDLEATLKATTKAPEVKKEAGPNEAVIAGILLHETQGNILKQEKDIFLFNGVYWEHMKPAAAADHFKRRIDAHANRKYKYKDLVSCYNRFLMHVPEAEKRGVNMFQPNPFRQNFRNGCLHIDLQNDGSYALSLHPHNREDYLRHCHHFEYQDSAPMNEEFESALKTIWGKDADFEEKKNLYYEVLGASLVSAFRKIVMFVGPAKSGKSTAIGVATNLVHKDYLCSVSPSNFNGFNMESMINKLVNYDTDLNLTKPLQDDILKKVEDGMPIRVQRKGISDVYSPIPGVHLYGSNDMPKSQDGVAAYDRRVVILQCNGGTIGDEYVKDYHAHLWKRCESWIVAKAIEGLKRLALNGGRFTALQSSKDAMATWKDNNKDEVEQFMEDINNVPIMAVLADDSSPFELDFRQRIEKKMVWLAFVCWVKQNALSVHSVKKFPGKHAFFAKLLTLGHAAIKVKGYFYYKGLSNCSPDWEPALPGKDPSGVVLEGQRDVSEY